MADAILDNIRELAEGQIDFKGQELAEVLATAMLVIVGAIAFVAGYILKDIKLVVLLGLGGTAVTFLLVVPPWPFLQKHPLQWLSVTTGNIVSQDVVGNSKVTIETQ